ncbi:hypothetical protein CDES_04580 [Corynebacterium deserti GIMN1.010]|uniref:Uncharacterized protein n=1 Tax=Corynebacterium deserti GIMN1.010 TaxID=931089 RepID=A0A0M5IFX9_9CORY|nr:hypothetical protein [Corynebacterium deserti]ALC05361.1 hypothetical protein CDES_04580 [Corynebacterium deserti GIMN1.010]
MSFALLDSVNVLLIGIIVAIAALLPRQGKYGRISTLLIAGDWLGVFLLSILVMLVFDGLQGMVQSFLDSIWFGLILLVTGIVSFFATMLSKSGNGQKLDGFLAPVKTPSWKTVGAGLILGLVQSATSVPFYAGLGYLSIGEFGPAIRYGGLVVYASLALSLPTLVAVLVGLVRKYPESPVGKLFELVGQNKERVTKWAGYIVAVILCIMGIASMM